MNHDEHRLKRLFKAAAKSPPETLASIPIALETRIIARWRSPVPVEQPESPGLTVFVRRAMVCAVLVMVTSFGWSWFSNAHEVPGAVALEHLAQAIQIVP